MIALILEGKWAGTYFGIQFRFFLISRREASACKKTPVISEVRRGLSLGRTVNSCEVFFAANSDLDRFGSVAVVRIRFFFIWFGFYSHPFNPRTGRLYSKCAVYHVDQSSFFLSEK
jgi:hypothetical protein